MLLSNYLKTTLRSLWRYRGFSLINGAGLAVGMACCILILSYVSHELSFDAFHEKAGRIYRLTEIQAWAGRDPLHIGVTMGVMGPTILNNYPEVEEIVRFFGVGERMVRRGDRRVEIGPAGYVDAAVFEVFDFRLVSGDPATALKEPHSVVLSRRAATSVFAGTTDPIGESIHIDGKAFQVTGIMDNPPSNSHLQLDAFLSFSTTENDPAFAFLNEWVRHNVGTYLLLREDTDPAALVAKFPTFVETYIPERKDIYTLLLQPLTDVHLLSQDIHFDINWFENDVVYIYSFSGIAFLILLIACVNFMNLSTARSTRRAREVGLRKVVGADRFQLTRQFLGESLLLACFSAVIALGTIYAMASPFDALVGRAVTNSVFSDPVLMVGFVGITLFVGLIAGFYPALYLASFRPVIVLKGSAAPRVGTARVRKMLVVAQFTVTVVLINATGLALKQFNYLRTKNLGFDKEQVVSISLPDSVGQRWPTIRAELVRNPDIVGATISRLRLGSTGGESSFVFEGYDPEQNWITPYNGIDYDFLPFFGIELVAGRNFSPDIASDTSRGGAYIINQTLARKVGWTEEEAIGKAFSFGRNTDVEMGTIVGVAKDFHFQSLHKEIETLALFAEPVGGQHVSIRIRPGPTAETIGFIEATWNRFAPGWPFQYRFLDEHLAELYDDDRRAGVIFGSFAVLAIVIACLGLYGLATFTAEQRTREIGVRKVLGASVSTIVFLVSKDFTQLVGLAILLAIPISVFVMGEWLNNFAYRVDLSWTVFALGGVLAIGIAWLSVGYHAVRVAHTNPVEALRTD